jgi:hypothetical protein
MQIAEKFFDDIRKHAGLAAVVVIALFITFSTRPATLQQLLGVDYPVGGRFSLADVFKASIYLPGRLEKYFNQNFSSRDRLVHANYWFRLNVAGEKDFHDVLLGKDSWLYYSGEQNLDYYQHTPLLNQSQIASLLDQLAGTQNELAKRNIKFLVVVAPNKETIYPEYLPAEIQQSGDISIFDQILNANEKYKLPIIDLRPALLEAKKNGQIYYRTDTHWNPEGAFAAYQVIAGELHKLFPTIKAHPIQDFSKTPEKISGDLAVMLTMKNELAEESHEMQPVFNRKAETTNSGDGYLITSTTGDSNMPKAVIFRDSFYNGLQPYLAEHFQQAILVRSFKVDMPLIDQEKTDLVIMEIAERYLPELLNTNN